MSDYLLKSVVDDGQFRAYAVDATELVREAQQRHDTWSAASAALGRTLIATLMLSSSVLKGDDTLTVRINGGGPVGGIVVDGNANGTVKGYLQNPHVNLPLNKRHKIDVAKAVGVEGSLSVTKDLGLDKPYTGQVPLASGEIGDDFTYYLAQSEQIPSAVGVSVFVNDDNSIQVAGGFLVQVMPGAKDEAISHLEKRLKEVPMVSELLLDGQKPEDMLNLLFGEKNVKILDNMPVSFKCDCSKEQFSKALASISKNQLQQIIDEDHHAETVCNFCKNKYEFSEDELKAILASM
ncbi:Hsp33 family molecular chaperone HslO [Lactobacillus sp. LC28-10]|uniref:33 kDa chaperonin n=1 Tax=Secundilactobacillus angelensis TaxID=2722706 RepID=A0ABX1KZ37_9LACO|nr:Hsp33 family molecular chaperone HslO [Secundilactobacillus angelensis]MCH5463097.1 Hsp33 family molecular chaperone HslO [Secundilactobacillus angelensis]NLR18904.1 Hsp33 family molecular chaperone HslO [Secundilactobacillus angelensis]